jgi:hypothetical protein
MVHENSFNFSILTFCYMYCLAMQNMVVGLIQGQTQQWKASKRDKLKTRKTSELCNKRLMMTEEWFLSM